MILGGCRQARQAGSVGSAGAGRCVKINFSDQAQIEAIGGCVLSRAGGREVRRGCHASESRGGGSAGGHEEKLGGGIHWTTMQLQRCRDASNSQVQQERTDCGAVRI